MISCFLFNIFTVRYLIVFLDTAPLNVVLKADKISCFSVSRRDMERVKRDKTEKVLGDEVRGRLIDTDVKCFRPHKQVSEIPGCYDKLEQNFSSYRFHYPDVKSDGNKIIFSGA